jgi:hypothetical protein
MGIFNKGLKESRRFTTKGFYFGHTEAEGENKAGSQNLDHYFEDYLNVLPRIADEKFIFVGRKGTGKSAIAKFIKDSSEIHNDSFCDLIKFNDIELEEIVQAIPRDNKEHVEVIVFEWLILVRLIRLFVKNVDAQQTREYEKLKNFIGRNAGFVEIDKYHITEIVEKKKLEVSIDVLKHVFGSAIGKYIDTKAIKAPFYQLVNPLKDIVKTILAYPVYQNKEYIILFDDLDIKFKSDDETCTDRLLNLLRAVKNLNTSIFKGSTVKTLVFLRDDIAEVLETKDSDGSKLFSSYEIYLSWYDHDSYKLNENQTNLKRFINKRISINFEANSIEYNKEDPWQSLFHPIPSTYDKTSFKYVLDCTFYRPRDLVLFLSAVGLEEYNYPIDYRILRSLLVKYVHSNVKELKSELSIHFNQIEVVKIFNVLKRLTYGYNNTKSEIENYIKAEFSDDVDVEKIFNYLLVYSFIIYRDPSSGKLFFNYRERSKFLISSENMTYSLHKCLYSYFNPESL